MFHGTYPSQKSFGFLRRQTAFGAFPGHIYLSQDRHDEILFLCFLLDAFRQLVRTQRMNHDSPADHIFDFIPLQIADHMPSEILRQNIIFVPELLRLIFTEV